VEFVLALPQFRHASPQLVERQKLFLIGVLVPNVSKVTLEKLSVFN
jgi:hypothetical protein